ncbi:serine/threonine protein kinase [Nannocystis sp. ILAH1]|uniref:serine/threonine protein kinase n=1 Tax=unclassified Nannocystis TaxID=2627009 RepID=UPI0022720E27|nr:MULTISPECIES: serine/threonine-protein kinase [unclassified Nannocystis]MCY0986159.1 serine/threonine protein kinase [Nannocystis sp. ILAH1]MCY1068755.1 serine/threonine protein kinase [Nannocystis sp. RBIL2]
MPPLPKSRPANASLNKSEMANSAASSSTLEVSFNEDVGRVINGRYELLGVIGEGGMGVVFEAHDHRVDRRVAIKLVRRECLTDSKFIIRFRRELEVTAQLRHPSTIRVFEHGECEDGRPYMVMELLTGTSLCERLEQGKIPELQALQFAKQIAESLSEAHENGIFHRDLKPDNIFIETVGVSTVVKVLDFGIAGGVDAMRLTRAGEVFGTPQYMSPEQCNGTDLDHRTDIYSLGCILYEMIEGKPPFSAESPMATMLKHVRAKVPTPRNGSQFTAKLLQLALRKDRTKRIQSAGRFAELVGQAIGAVRAAEEGRVVHIPELSNQHTGPFAAVGTPQRVTMNGALPPQESNRNLFIAIGVGVAVLLVGIALIFRGGDGRAGDDAPTPVEAKAAQPIGSEGLPKNRAIIKANIEGASVHVDGEFQCKSPCEITVPVGDNRSHEIRLTLDGYIDVVQNWRPLTVTDSLPPFPDLKPISPVLEVKSSGKKRPG